MHIALTHGYFLHEDPKELEIMRPYPTLGLLYVSAYLKENNIPVDVIDSTFINRDEWLTKVKEMQPTVLAFYTNLMTKVNILELVKLIRKEVPRCVLVAGGPDITYNVENYLDAGFDITISGEGEQTMLELVQAIEANSDLSTVSGIAYNDGAKITVNEARTKIRELSTLPMPDRSAIPIDKYLDTWKKHHGKRTLNISTQRGCPYTCKWCSTAVYGQSYRRNTPQKVVEEIRHLIDEYKVEALWFVDDVFTVSHKWLAQLHAEFKKYKLTIPFEIITRAERLNETVLTQLKEMGCFRIWIGAESGSQRIIDKMDRRVDLKTVQQMIVRTETMGMEAGTFIMVGYPTETHEDLMQTMEHIKSANPSYLTITKAYPIKGTALYEEVKNTVVAFPPWETSTDRDTRIPLAYRDAYYTNAIRFLVNGWTAKRKKSLKHAIKSKLAYLMMKWNRKAG